MKNPLQSKTLWFNVLSAVLPIILPALQTYIAAHPAVATSVITGANLVLRFLTTQAVSFTPAPPTVSGR